LAKTGDSFKNLWRSIDFLGVLCDLCG